VQWRNVAQDGGLLSRFGNTFGSVSWMNHECRSFPAGMHGPGSWSAMIPIRWIIANIRKTTCCPARAHPMPESRGGQSRSRKTDGFGVRIALVRRIARWHASDAVVSVTPLGWARIELTWPTSSAFARRGPCHLL
jgi:hypothetical protein